MKKIWTLILLLTFIPSVFGVSKTIYVNQTVEVEVYNESGVIRHFAKLKLPYGSTPSEYSITDACELPHDDVQHFPYFLTVDVDCNTTTPTWDIGENITALLNMTSYLYYYQENEEGQCKETVKANIELSKTVEYLQGRLGELDKYSSLQSAYDVCNKDKHDAEGALKTCTDEKNEANGQKINYLIYGFVIAGVFLLLTRPKIFKSPAEREGWR